MDGKLCQRWSLSLDSGDQKDIELVAKLMQSSKIDEELEKVVDVLVKGSRYTWARSLALKLS